MLHSLPIGTGEADIDHVVVGPAGVFTINTKRHDGKRVWVSGGTVRVQGQRVPYIAKAEGEARRLTRLLERAGLDVGAVRPVLAFVGAAALDIRERPLTVLVVPADRLDRSLTKRPSAIDPERASAIVDHLDDPRFWRLAPQTADIGSRFASVHQAVRRARLVRRLWSFAVGVAVVLLAYLALTALPGLIRVLS